MAKQLPPPVQVKFVSLYEPDMATLAATLIPFGRWSEENIAEHLLVEVSLPAEISQRLKVLEGYLAPGGWPRHVATDAAEHVRGIVERMIPAAKAEIAQGVRLMAAAAIRDDGSRAADIRDEILSSFLAAKALAIARALRACTLVGESHLQWGPEFYEFATAYSDRVIHGLSFLAREPDGWAGWTDADLHIWNYHYRLYIPICPRPESTKDLKRFSDHDVRQLLLPQLLCTAAPYLAIRRVIFEPWETISSDLIKRGEQYIDTERCIGDSDSKAHIVRIAADRIAAYLQNIPADDREYELFKLTRSAGPLSSEIEERGLKLIPLD
ncbi:hypothetical protein [Bradyrhizobium sp. 25ACV]